MSCENEADHHTFVSSSPAKKASAPNVLLRELFNPVNLVIALCLKSLLLHLQGLVDRLHSVLRPFLLRRLKSEVEKQMPGKHEHVIRCRLSKRQRTLYEDYMASSDTRSTLSSGNFLGIINVLMSLRKVGPAGV